MEPLRIIIDQRFPRLARTLRQVRAAKNAALPGRWQTPFGFSLAGAAGANMAPSWPSSLDGMRFVGILGASDRLVDIGANIGVFSVLAARQGVPVIAIEPDASNRRLLLRNISHVSGAPVSVRPVAVSDEIGFVTLYGGGQGASLVRGWGGIESTYAHVVEGTTIDAIFEHVPPEERVFVKLDVEGHEWSAIEGASETLRRDPKPTWYVEHGLTTNFGGKRNPHFLDLFEAFWNSGYDAYPADSETKVTPAQAQAWMEQGTQEGVGSINFYFVGTGEFIPIAG